MSPTRRTALRASALLAIGLGAGCLTSSPGSSEGTPTPDGGSPTSGDTPTSGDDTPTPDATPTPDGGDGPGDGGDGSDGGASGTRPTGTGGPGVTLVSVDEPTSLPVRPTVEVTEDVATTEHPPQFRVTLTNESDETVSVGEGRAAVFAYVSDESNDLVLLPAEESYPAEADCWRLDEPIAITEEYRTIALDAGESVSRDLSLYGAAGGDGCLPVGEYRFTTTISVAPGTAVPDGERSAEWGFTILLE